MLLEGSLRVEVGTLRNSVALVTGASSGIGAAVARALNAEGARVAEHVAVNEILVELRDEPV